MRTGKFLMLASTLIFSSAGGFILAKPTLAKAGFRAVSGTICKYNGSFGFHSYDCALPVGSDFSTAHVTGAYFDFVSTSADTTTITLRKMSYNGLPYVDYAVVSIGTSPNDFWVPAVHVKESASGYDYMSASFDGVKAPYYGIYGVGLGTDN